VNHKWLIKIKQFNVKTADAILSGLQKNKSSISKKALTHLSDVKIVVQKHVQTSTMEVDKTAVVEDNESRSKSHVPNVEQKTQYHLSREAIDRYFAVTVLEKVNKANFSFGPV
jgi:hypothetical protein